MNENRAEKEVKLVQALRASGALPIVSLGNIGAALRIAEALLEGGLRVMEITLRQPGAAQAIRAVRDWFPEMIIGAGTILSDRTLKDAEQAGALFGVTPGLTPALARAVLDGSLPVLAGVETASEIMAASEAGLKLLKWYPAEAAGGLPVLEDLCRIFPDVSFLPTGKISQEQAAKYLRIPQVVACGASWVTPREMIEAKDFAGIAEKCRAALELAKSRHPS